MANPELVIPIPDQIVTKGQSVSLSIAGNLVDPDAVDRFLYTVQGLPVGTGFSVDQNTGLFGGTATAADVAAIPMYPTIYAALASNPNVVGSVMLTIDGVTEEPTVEATYYVSSTATGSGNGSLASPYTPSQAANINMLAIVPTPTTHLYVDWEPGNYDTVFVPRYGGISNDAKLVHRVRTAGVARIRGTSNDYGIELRLGIYSGQAYGVNYVDFEREADRNFEVDGRVVFGTGGGQIGKGQDPEPVASIRKGILLEGANCTLDLDVRRTAGWNGIDVGYLAGGSIIRINGTQHGTPFDSGPNDFGDQIWVSQSMNSSQRIGLDSDA